MAHNKKKAKSSGRSDQLEREIIDILKGNPAQELNYKQVSKILGIEKPALRVQVGNALGRLVKKGLISESRRGSYKIKTDGGGTITGTIDMTRQGYGFLMVEGQKDDVFIAAKNLRTALHGDTVRVRLFAMRKGARLEGEVIEITNRVRDSFGDYRIAA